MPKKVPPEKVTELRQQVENNAGEEEKPGKITQNQILMELSQRNGSIYFHDRAQVAYAQIEVDGRRETWPIRSKGYRGWLRRLFYADQGRSPSTTAFNDALSTIEALALFDGDQIECPVRVARHGATVCIDLCDATWSAAVVSASGYMITRKPQVLFVRRRGMLPLPAPALVREENAPEAIALLRRHLNIDDDDFVLVVSWLVAALWPEGPYPIAVLQGEQGTAKSTATRILRRLVDPNECPLRSQPREERDLVIAGSNSRVLAFDNVSTLPPWLSDALCRISTGGGFATRMLHTDAEEVFFNNQLPAMMNGIASFITRNDLADRALLITLKPIPKDKRKREAEVMAALDEDLPVIFGGLLRALSIALRRIENIALKDLPRMADFAYLIHAAEPALPWSSGEFRRVYAQNRASIIDTAVESNLVSGAIAEMMKDRPGPWIGTPTQLWERLSEIVGDGIARSKSWPKSPSILSRRLNEITSFLRQYGIEVDLVKNNNGRNIIIEKTEKK